VSRQGGVGHVQRRDRLLSIVAPGLLVTVAVAQLVVAQVSDLTPWRGGGFGMFSTVDGHDARFARISLELTDGTLRALNDTALAAPSLDEAITNYLALPGQHYARVVADTIVAAGHTAGDDVAWLHLEAWTVEYDRPSARLIPRQLDGVRIRP
jgi:hypothetical protein